MTTRSGTKPHAEWSDHPAKTLISTAAFNAEFYSYSTSYDSTQTPRGYLTVNPGATSANCPAGRILNLNGKRLVPGVNPMTDFGSTGLGPSPGTFLLGVFDSYTGLNGYINPSSATFILKDTNRPPSDFLVDMSVGQSLIKSTSLGGDGDPRITIGIAAPGFGGFAYIYHTTYNVNLANYAIFLSTNSAGSGDPPTSVYINQVIVLSPGSTGNIFVLEGVGSGYIVQYTLIDFP